VAETPIVSAKFRFRIPASFDLINLIFETETLAEIQNSVRKVRNYPKLSETVRNYPKLIVWNCPKLSETVRNCSKGPKLQFQSIEYLSFEVSDSFGPFEQFQIVSDSFRQLVSDSFKQFRTVSDSFGPFKLSFGFRPRFRISDQVSDFGEVSVSGFRLLNSAYIPKKFRPHV